MVSHKANVHNLNLLDSLASPLHYNRPRSVGLLITSGEQVNLGKARSFKQFQGSEPVFLKGS